MREPTPMTNAKFYMTHVAFLIANLALGKVPRQSFLAKYPVQKKHKTAKKPDVKKDQV